VKNGDFADSEEIAIDVVVVLSERTTEKAIDFLYVYLEPLADAVIALG
jgi:hypothetical protein